MKVVSYLFILLFVFSSIAGRAQTGCLVPANGTVYTQTDDVGLVNALLIAIFGGVQAYKPSPNEPQLSTCVANAQKKWTAGSSPCRVCPSGYNVLNLVTGCSGTALEGSIATSSMIYCNLDDHSWALGLAAGALGLIIIRRKKLL